MQNEKYLSRDKTQALIDELKVTKQEGPEFLKSLANKGYTIEGYNDKKPEPTNFMGKVGGIASERLNNIKNIYTKDSVTSPVNLAASSMERGLRTTGQVVAGVGDIIGAGIGSAASTANDLTGGSLGEVAKSGISKILDTEAGKQGLEFAKMGMEKYGAWKQANPNAAADLEAVVNIASIIPVGKVLGITGSTAKTLATETAQGAKTLVKEAPALVKTTTKVIQDIGKAPKTLEKAVGEIAQGTTETINPVKTALSVVDTSKVNTYSDLLGQINKTIPDLVTKVDNELLKDSTKYSLSDLTVKKSTKAGTEVVSDYVTKGLKELKDYYTSIGDDVAKADIEDLITRANTEGLTRKEVNDIARLHGKELSAYNANGQLSSGLTKQAAENTRKGLKEVARQGLGGKEAKMLDEQLSALFDTQNLIEKNVEKVNKLQQTIQERGLVEKIGYNFSKYADILTGGSIRGLVGGILPRGVGNKTMNALDLEEALRSNLDIVEKALKSKTDKELINNLNQLKSSVDDSARSNSSLNKNTTTTTNKTTNNTVIDSSIPQTPNKASGKLGGFAQILEETPTGKLKGKMLKEDVFAVEDFLNVFKGKSKVPDQTYLAMRKELKNIAKQYGINMGKDDRTLLKNLVDKINQDRKIKDKIKLGILPKAAIITAGGAGAIKLMSTQDK